MKSVLLIAPRAKNKSASDISVIKTPLSGILILGTMLSDKDYSVKMYDESFKTPNYDNIDADFVLITSMSATVNRAYELGDLYREKGSKVFMGGLYVTFEPDEAIKHCDRVVSTIRIINYLSSFSQLRTLCFDEPNFTADKKRAIDILKQIKENGITPKYAWPSVSIDVANDDELLK